MKRTFVVLVLIISFTALYAQDKSARDYKVEAAEAYKAKDYQKGLASFEKAIQLYEADGKIDTTLYFNAAICAIKLKEFQKSIAFFDRSVELGYKACKSKLYKATAQKGMEDYAAMEATCNEAVASCPEEKDEFNGLLFQYYLKSGLDVFNNAAKMQADATPLAKSNPDGYKAEMEKVKAEFTRSLPMLEKANRIDPADENCKKALKQAYDLLDMKDKAASL